MAAPNRNGFETGRGRTDRKRQGKHDGHDCGNVCCYMTLKCVSSSMRLASLMPWHGSRSMLRCIYIVNTALMFAKHGSRPNRDEFLHINVCRNSLSISL